MKTTTHISFLIIISVLYSCKHKTKNGITTVEKPALKDYLNNDSFPAGEVLGNDYDFFADSVLHGYKAQLKYYFAKYSSDTSCGSYWHFVNKKSAIEYFEGFKNVGDINRNKITDSVFVLEPLNYCKFPGEETFDGQAYYFTDTLLPRLQTDSYCCHPSNLFDAGDIDEDGIDEIGVYYSSCSSRYKSVIFFTLKNRIWKEIAASAFDIMTQDPDEIKLINIVRKISKNKFQVKNFIEGKKYWKTYSMN